MYIIELPQFTKKKIIKIIMLRDQGAEEDALQLEKNLKLPRVLVLGFHGRSHRRECCSLLLSSRYRGRKDDRKEIVQSTDGKDYRNKRKGNSGTQ